MFALIQLLLANRRILAYTLVIIGLCGTLWLVHRSGYRDGVAEITSLYEKRMEEESERLRLANAAALQEANKRRDAMMQYIRDRNDEIAKLEAEAQADPDSGNGALSGDSVSRINRIR